MRTVYRPIAALTCRHSFFADGVATPLSLPPLADSARLMRSHRCLLHNQPGGGIIHAGLDEAGQLAASLDAATPLAFALTCDVAHFAGYTATDWSPGGVVYYANRPEPPADPSAPSERVLMGTLLARKGRAFRYDFASPQKAKTVSVRRWPDATPAFAASAPQGEFATLALDLSSLAEGRYELFVDDASALAFYLSDSDATGLFGVVELFGLGALAAAPPSTTPPLYVVSLQARATLWRYLILGAAGADIAVAGLLDRKQPIAFTGPTPTPLGGETAAAFQSTEPIPLLERPAGRYAMSLTIRGSGPGGDVTQPLPFAGRETASGAAGVSEIVARM
ncbi:MAG: hypothetical protein JO107_05650 [Hyphomicrobiales bacterium]|nr:hypothetical protein [Hyphomicrobiales bacterium]